MTRRPLIVGNWKLHNDVAASVALARAVAEGVAAISRGDDSVGPDVVVAPVFTALDRVREALRGSAVGLAGQDMHWDAKGAFTGEVSGPLLTDVGCSYVIVGHSERRQHFGDTDERVRRKVEAAVRAGLLPIACVGETLEEREAGRTHEVVLRQLDAIADGLPDPAFIVLAYEPVWAIGTGRVARAEDAQEVHRLLRARLDELTGVADAVQILYGGSVKPDNAAGLLSQPDIDGALVGGASLDADQFLGIVRAA